MKIHLNGEDKDVPRGLDIEALMDHLSLPTERVAVEVNLDVVPRGRWSEVPVAENDRIEIIHFVGGG